ncbi:MAG TPA: PfkB family carbohydrate kinase [Mycobacteriales bacterium]|nr:PfkB family carbohydrate kinase [Mycobacteriales bacterium]
MTGAGRPPRGVFVGLSTLDVVYRVVAPPRANQKVVGHDQLVLAGGPASNAAVAFGGLGGAALLVTALGGHPLSRMVVDELARYGVDCLDATPGFAGPPPLSAVMVSAATGERAVVSDNGVRAEAGRVDLTGRLRDADVVLVDGHHPGLVRAALRAAVRHGVPVVVDGGSWQPVFAEVMPRAEFALCSADLRVPGVPAERTLDALLGLGARAAGVSDGARPLRWATATDRGEVPVPRVDVVDTLGAGDVLHGATAFAVASRGASAAALRRWLPWAVSVASLSATSPGTRTWLGAVDSLPPPP